MLTQSTGHSHLELQSHDEEIAPVLQNQSKRAEEKTHILVQVANRMGSGLIIAIIVSSLLGGCDYVNAGCHSVLLTKLCIFGALSRALLNMEVGRQS
jgi:hypothetical protein